MAVIKARDSKWSNVSSVRIGKRGNLTAVFLLATILLALGSLIMRRQSSPKSSSLKKARATRGRPPVHHETWSKVSVVLFDRQLSQLSHLATNASHKTRKPMTRAEIIRALIDGFIESGLDLSEHGTEATLRAHIAKRLAE